MDGSDSLGERPRDEDSESDPSSIDPAEPGDRQSGLFGRLLRSASDALGTAPPEQEAAWLGAAFQDSSRAELGMVHNILRLRELRVEDVMTPRADILAVPEDAELDDVIGAFERGSFSRLPVYRETLDEPIGFVHLKDLALSFGVGIARPVTPFKLSDHLHAALFVPPSMRIVALLQRMQGARVHMALVIDEFGGVDGLVTIEDLVEQIVGDIDDEHDDTSETAWSHEHTGVYLIDARADIREFEEQTGVSLAGEERDEEVDTMGGLVFMLANRVPSRGEMIAHPMGHEFEIVDADARRIKHLRLTLNGVSQTSPAVALRQAAE